MNGSEELSRGVDEFSSGEVQISPFLGHARAAWSSLSSAQTQGPEENHMGSEKTDSGHQPPTRRDRGARRRTDERSRRTLIWVSAAAGVALVLSGAALAVTRGAHSSAHSPSAATNTVNVNGPRPGGQPVVEPVNLEALPEARYDAVIGGLIPYASGADRINARYTIPRAVALYGADRKTPVAKLEASDFSGQPTTVVVVDQKDGWSLILTPARVSLPSKAGGHAAAQSAAWVPSAALTKAQDLPSRIVISAGDQKLRIVTEGKIVAEYAVGVGTPETPTPTNVTGYLQQRYLAAAQHETTYPIQLTSLHSSAADEPYGGSDGGLIGIHYNATNSGAVSHGCIRLTADAILAVSVLPLGTPITITP